MRVASAVQLVGGDRRVIGKQTAKLAFCCTTGTSSTT
jgi:hypothetical protein